LTSIKRRVINDYGLPYWEKNKETILSKIGIWEGSEPINSKIRRFLRRHGYYPWEEKEPSIDILKNFKKQIDDIIFQLHKFLPVPIRTDMEAALLLAKPFESLYSRRIAKESGIPRSTIYNRLKKAKALE